MLFSRAVALGYYIARGLSQALPTVDLGYEIHQANAFNVSTNHPGIFVVLLMFKLL
jgi:hypothetical protein